MSAASFQQGKRRPCIVERLEDRVLLTASLLTNFDRQPANVDLSNLTGFRSHLFFTTRQNGVGDELFSSDGTTAGTALFKDINPGPADSAPDQFTVSNGSLYFTADDGSHGRELWKTDGTAAGTQLVSDIDPGPRGSNPTNLVDVNGILFFQAYDGSGLGLYTTDGTDSGTHLVTRLFSGPANPYGPAAASAGGKYFFGAYDAHGGYELWSSDGTPGGTGVVIEINASPGFPNLFRFTGVGSTLFFVDFTTKGDQLWATDGTDTHMVDLSGIQANDVPSSIVALTPFNGTLCFTGVDPTNKTTAVWRTDGTIAGTSVLHSVVTGSSSTSTSQRLVESHGYLYFVDPKGSLYQSDGTAAGTELVKTGIDPSAQMIDAGSQIVLTDNKYNELLASDGTAAGTRAIAQISAANVVDVNGTIFLATPSPSMAGQLWTASLAGGASLLKQFVAGVGGGLPLGGVVAAGGGVFFSYGNMLGHTDGTPTGTQLIADIGSAANNLTPVGGDVYFQSNGIWKSDATTSGTQLLIPHLSANILGAFQGELYFSDLATNESGGALWKTDGTAAGTLQVAPLNVAGIVATSQSLIATVVDDTGYSRQLWASDGTTVGTTMLMTFPTRTHLESLTPVGGKAFFVQQTEGAGTAQLWVTDGTVAGTTMLLSLPTPTYISSIYNLTAAGGTLLFTVAQGGPQVLWKSDGTPAGTLAINQPRYVGTLFSVGSEAFFFGFPPGSTAQELWKSDGTDTGTVPVALVTSEGVPAPIQVLDAVGGILYFGGRTADGEQYWRSDGTATGTYVVADVEKATDSAPSGFIDSAAILGDQFIFPADDGRKGPELWEAPVNAVPPHAQIGAPPSPRIAPVDKVVISFSLPVTGLQLRDLALSRDGIADLLTGSEELTTTDGMTWILTGIGPLTSTPGVYTLSLAADSAVQDGAGEPVLTDASAGFTVSQPFALDFAYFMTLAQHYDQPGGLMDGDLNGDGKVDFTDLLLLAQTYGNRAVAAVAAAHGAP